MCKKAAPNQAASRLKLKRRPANAFMARSGGVFQRLQIGFYSGVVDPQKLVGGGHHVDAVGLTLGPFSVHELVDWLIQWRPLQIDAHDKEQRSPQKRRTNFAHTLVPASYIARIIRRSIKTGISHQCFLGVKAAYIANFGYELRIIRELCQGLEIDLSSFFASPLFDENNLEP